MSQVMQTKKVIIANPSGLHARAAAKLVAKASGYTSQIQIRYGEKAVDGKSIMRVITLGAGHGAELELSAHGVDEETALQDLEQLIKDRFGETE